MADGDHHLRTLDDAVDSLRLRPVGEDRFEATGRAMVMGHWVFGGLLAGQVLMAALATGDGRRPRSIHVAFLRRGALDRPVELSVTRTADSRTFASRHVLATQGEETLVEGHVMLHEPEESPLQHQAAAPAVHPPDQPDPGGIPMFDMVDPNEPRSNSRAVGEPRMRNWFRAPTPLDSADLDAAMLCLASDMTLVSTAWRPYEGLAVWDFERTVAHSLTFTAFFHRPSDFSRWHLLDAASSVAGQGRSLSHGSWFAADGALVASVAMDAVMRLRSDAADDADG